MKLNTPEIKYVKKTFPLYKTYKFIPSPRKWGIAIIETLISTGESKTIWDGGDIITISTENVLPSYLHIRINTFTGLSLKNMEYGGSRKIPNQKRTMEVTFAYQQDKKTFHEHLVINKSMAFKHWSDRELNRQRIREKTKILGEYDSFLDCYVEIAPSTYLKGRVMGFREIEQRDYKFQDDDNVIFCGEYKNGVEFTIYIEPTKILRRLNKKMQILN